MKLTTICLLTLLFFSEKIISQQAAWPFEKVLDSLVFSKKFKPENPGFAVIVIENGRIVYERQTGRTNLKKGLPIGPETMFNIGSITKQFTAAGILLLEEQGKLRTSDSIQQYLPELPGFGKTITLDHLLGHTSGIPDHFEVEAMKNKFGHDLNDFEKVIQLLQAAPELAFAPGSDFAYCNTGYMLLAMVIERVSGMSYQDFLQQNIFQPLGMRHSNAFKLEKDGLPDGTTSYSYVPKKGKFKHSKPYPNAIGATGVQCSLRDFFLWDQNFYHNQFGSQALISKMETPYHLNNGATTNYGGGLFLKPYRGLRMVAHGGGWNSFLMDYRQFPDLKTTVLVASNNDFSNPFQIADSIGKLILKFPPPATFTPSLQGLSLPAQKLEGVFLSASNFIRYVRFDSLGLAVVIPSASKETALRLSFQKSVGDSLLVFKDEQGDELLFHLDATQKVLGLTWEGGHFFRLRRFYQKLDPPATETATQIFAGKYRSNAFDQTIKVRRNRRSGRLKVKPVFFISYALEPIGGGAFKVEGEAIVLRFQDGGLVLGNDWVSGLKMKKKK